MPATAPEPAGTTTVSAPFQGLVTVLVDTGARVESGEVLAVLEAMKMEAPITAPRAGTVTAVAFAGTQAVAGGDVLVHLA
ncbi:biotin/lipoyl-containing protein [Nocardioides jishulii]|uniref:biotin/lipoyl-containing protein n=1 Tax=Nocardioides jishulii TaxID=2575440 RepID=UPI001BAECB62|nr:biotin/lipoyl-containing protein [Nocardioides jishulii]